MANPQTPQQQRAAAQNLPRRRILRIGIILGGKIIEERLVRDRKDVTIGQSSKNTFSVPIEGLPREWPLFAVHDGKYYLRFADNMDGRVSDGQGVHTLDVLKSGYARQQGNAWVMPLPETSRGKISLGEMTLLFQFVTEPPRVPRPRLPASVRGTFADRIDPQLSVILAISIIVHFGIALYAYQRDRKDPYQGRSAQVYKDSFERPSVTIEDPLEFEPEEGDTDAQGEETAEKEPEKDKPVAEKPRNTGPKEPAGGNTTDPVQLQEEVTAAVNSMFSEDFGQAGDTGGISDRNPGASLEAQIDHTKDTGAKVELGGGSGRGTRGGRDAEAGTGQGPNVRTTDIKDDPQKTAEKVPDSRINPSRPAGDSAFLDPNAVLRKINTVYMRGLKRCHRQLLKRDPSAGGKVNLKFIIGESGRVTRSKVNGFDPGVDACIQKQVNGWRFNPPKDDGMATDAQFQLSLQLQPT